MANTEKQRALEAIQQLPEDATFDEAIERILFLAKIDRGIAQAEAGQTISHEDAIKRLLKK